MDDANVYHPDIVVLRDVPSRDAPYVMRPLLVVEVLSPSTAWLDRDVKRAHLLAGGTGEVWLVDPETETLEVADGAGVRIASEFAPLASRVLPGFTLVPRTLFA